MAENKSAGYWILNILPTIWLFLFANQVFGVYIYLRGGSLPLGTPAGLGPLWPADYLLGREYYSASIAAVAATMGAVAALRYRSRWGAATAAVLVTLTLEHFLLLAYLRP